MAKNPDYREIQQAARHQQQPESAVVAEVAPPEQPAVETPAEAVYVVAPGKTITTLRGPAAASKLLTARDFVHGQVALDELVARGDVLKTESGESKPGEKPRALTPDK